MIIKEPMVKPNNNKNPSNPVHSTVVGLSASPKGTKALKKLALTVGILLLVVGLVVAGLYGYRQYYYYSNTKAAVEVGGQFMEAFKKGDGPRLESLFTER